MIIRISTEGQYEVGDADLADLNELDNAAVAACTDEDEDRFHDVYDRLLALVRARGNRVGTAELVGSDLLLPPPDVSLREAHSEFRGEGIIPD